MEEPGRKQLCKYGWVTPEESNVEITVKRGDEKESRPFLRYERGHCGHSESNQVVSLKPRLDVEATTLRIGKILKFFSVFSFCFECFQIYDEKTIL